MFKSRTVLVVGAGGSHEIGLPIGAGLAESISRLLYFKFDSFGQLEKGGDYRFFEILRRRFPDNEELNRYLLACRKIHDGVRLAESIDNYIDRHKDEAIAFCGKVAIANLILKAERGSALNVAPPKTSIAIQGLPECWYLEFFKIVTNGLSRDRLDEIFQDVTIIDFNYDRCLSQFLRYALSIAYGIALADADKLIPSLKIIKPYGQVGSLRLTAMNDGVHFGEDIPGERLIDISTDLKTYTEQIDDVGLRAQLSNSLVGASQIIFLGFAFHPQNMSLMVTNSEAEFVLGTALGFSQPDTEAIRENISQTFFGATGSPGSSIVLENHLKCAQLLRDYRRSIAA